MNLENTKFRMMWRRGNSERCWVYWNMSDMNCLFDNTDKNLEKTAGQFAGLQDKNGVEVYEGDIVDFEDLKGEIQRGYICYRAGSFRISNKLGVVNHTDTEVRMWYDGNNEWHSIENLDQMDIKVIGNIHQSPELLNQ